MKILLTGSSGYIGQAFVEELFKRGIHYLTASHHLDIKPLFGVVEHCGIDAIINCAAYTGRPNVDACEDAKSETILGNVVFPLMVLEVAKAYDIPFLQVSTGCLYNGDNNGLGWSEKDEPQLSFETRCGIYVGTKELAERQIAKYDKAYICRIRLPFDHTNHPRNYLTKLMTYPKVYIGTNSITHRGDFVKACLDMLEQQVPFGIYNMTNPGAVSTWYIIELLQKHVCPEKRFDAWNEVEFMRLIARTPKSNCVLDTSKLRAAGIQMRPVRAALEDSVNKFEICTHS